MAASKKRHRPQKSQRKGPPDSSNEDWTVDWMIYFGMLAIGIFGVGILGTVSGPDSWRSILIGYVLAMICLINFCVFKAYRGRPMERWQKALARIALSFAGYGAIRGKNLSEAKDDDRAGLALWLSIAISVTLLAVISWWLLQPASSAVP